MSDPTMERIHQEFAATERIERIAYRYARWVCRKLGVPTTFGNYPPHMRRAVQRLAKKRSGIAHWCR